jgi:hypothetical protein
VNNQNTANALALTQLLAALIQAAAPAVQALAAAHAEGRDVTDDEVDAAFAADAAERDALNAAIAQAKAG